MRAVVFDRQGPPDVLRIGELPVPTPTRGQLRIRVRTGGVQPFDTLVRRGALAVPIRYPQQLGNEFAGVVDQVGPDAGGWAVGDEVLGWANMTALAEYAVVDTDAVVRKPSDMPWETAGAIGASGQTALTALDDLDVRAGDTLLVHAAAGGAGSAAVQIARARGATVIGTASSENHEYLRELGAVPIGYGPGLVDRVRRQVSGEVDAALDAIGGRALRDSLSLVANPDRIGTLVDHDLAAELGVRGIRARRTLAHLYALLELYQRRLLRVVVRATFPLEAVADAHRMIESGHGRGKVVISVC